MLKQTLIFRFSLVVLLALSMVACKDDEEPTPAAPSITSVAPEEAMPGEQVIISGTNLGFADEVRFGDHEAEIENNTNSNIIAIVPVGVAAGSQQITVTTAGGTATHAFTVLQAPVAEDPDAEDPDTEDPDAEDPDAEDPDAADLAVALTADDAFIISGYGETVLLTANVEGPAARVVFYDGEEELVEVTEAPFTFNLEVGDDVAAYTNYHITARVFDAEDNQEESGTVVIRVGERFAIGAGELTGVIEFNPEDEFVERWNEDGPTQGALPDDGRYPGFLNWDGDGDLEAASGVNLPVSVPEAGQYIVSLGMATGWEEDESYMYFYFNDNVEGAQRSPEVAPTGWVDFNDYALEEPFELSEGEHTAKIRFGGPFVHPYYVDLFRFE